MLWDIQKVDISLTYFLSQYEIQKIRYKERVKKSGEVNCPNTTDTLPIPHSHKLYLYQQLVNRLDH